MTATLRWPLLALLLAGVPGPGCAPAGDERPNILLITLDTTRADHLGCYGYGPPTSPHLDALAAESVLYTRAYSVSSWTLPAHASLFTGKVPSVHGAQYDPEGPISLGESGGSLTRFGQYRARPLAQDEVTLAGVLSRQGYATGGVVAGPWMKTVFSMNRGFDVYDDRNITALNGRLAEDVTDAAIGFLEDHDDPFFLFLNYYDPHGPLQPPSEYARRFVPPGVADPDNELSTAKKVAIYYDAEIAYMDEHLGRLLDHLRETGRFEDTWILVTADHGELFGENGMRGHGESLSQPEIHIPLVVKGPGAGAPVGRNDTPVQQVDVLPTILTALGLPLPPDIQGTPMPLGAGGGAPGHPIVAEVYPLPFMSKGKNKSWRQRGDWQALIDPRSGHKFVQGSRDRHQLFDLEADPGEVTNLFDTDPQRAGELQQRLTTYLQSLPRPGEVGETGEVDEETLEALKGLGYIGG